MSKFLEENFELKMIDQDALFKFNFNFVLSYLRLLSGSGSLRRWNRSFGQHLVHFAYD